MNIPDIKSIKNFFLKTQNIICQKLEKIDNTSIFIKDNWKNSNGKGQSRVMNGEIFEKVGVNFSHVYGNNIPITATANRSYLEGYTFEVTGISLIIHPKNPYIPTSHANLRFFIARKPKKKLYGGLVVVGI